MQKYKYQWYILFLMMLVWGGGGIAHNCITYLFPYFSKSFLLGMEHNGYLSGILALFWCMSILICGKLLAYFKAKNIMCCGILLASVSFLFLSFTNDISFVYILIAFAGFGCGSIVPTSFSILTKYCDPKRRGLFFGAAQSSYTLIGSAIGTIIFTRFANSEIGWQGSFLIIGIILCIVCVLILSCQNIFRGKKEIIEIRENNLTEVLKYKNILLATFLTCLAMMWYFTTASYGIIYLNLSREVSIVQAGAVFSGFGIGGFIGEFLGPTISDYFGRKKTVAILASLGGLAFFTFVKMDVSWGLTTFLLAMASCFMSGAMIILNSVIPSESVPIYLSDRATSFTPAMGEIFGGVFAPIIVGFLTKTIAIENILVGITVLPLLICIGAVFFKETVK